MKTKHAIRPVKKGKGAFKLDVIEPCLIFALQVMLTTLFFLPVLFTLWLTVCFAAEVAGDDGGRNDFGLQRNMTTDYLACHNHIDSQNDAILGSAPDDDSFFEFELNADVV